MRRFDKKKNIEKANLLAESRHLNRGTINESPWNGNPESNWVPGDDDGPEPEFQGINSVTIYLTAQDLNNPSEQFDKGYHIEGDVSIGYFGLEADDLMGAVPNLAEGIKNFGNDIVEAIKQFGPKLVGQHNLDKLNDKVTMVDIDGNKLRKLPHFNDTEEAMGMYFDEMDHGDINYTEYDGPEDYEY